MTDNKFCIELKNLTKKFENTLAVDNVSFNVEENEFFTILGPSGCGKSTVLRLIAGLEVQDQGEIIINGIDCSKMPANERPVNMVFQSYALFPHLNIKDNIEFGLKIKKIDEKEIKKRVDEILDLIKMRSYINKYPSELSGGQRQRVALARAIVNNPKIVLLDEPAAGMNSEETEDIARFIIDLHEERKKTVVLVDHDMNMVMDIAEKVMVLNFGEKLAEGTPKEIVSNENVIEAYLGGS